MSDQMKDTSRLKPLMANRRKPTGFERRPGTARRVMLWGAAFLLSAAYVGLAYYYVTTGALNADEDFYCLAARNVMRGEIPYRDFAYSQMPILPYVNGLAMKAVGFGFVNQRLVNATWGLLTLLAGMVLTLRISGILGAVLFGWMFVASPHWMYFTCLGKTYALAGLFLLLAAGVLYLRTPRLLRIAGFSLTGALAVGCRLTVLPAVAVLWAAMVVRCTSRWERLAAMVLPLLTACALLGPFCGLAPEGFLFWNIEYHLGSAMDRRGGPSLAEHGSLAPGVVCLVVMSAMGIVFMRRRTRRGNPPDAAARRTRERSANSSKFSPIAEPSTVSDRMTSGDPRLCQGPALLLAGLAGVVTQLLLRSSYGENSVPFLALLTVGALAVLAPTPWAKWTPFAAFVPAVAFLIGPMPGVEPGLRDRLESAARFVQSNTAPHEKLLTPFPLIAIQADREVVAGSEMGKFCLTAEMDEERAARLHLLTPESMLDLIRKREPAAVVFHSFFPNWNFGWSVPSLRYLTAERRGMILDLMRQQYRVGLRNGTFVVLLRAPLNQ